jgi:hypothetical protein
LRLRRRLGLALLGVLVRALSLVVVSVRVVRSRLLGLLGRLLLGLLRLLRRLLRLLGRGLLLLLLVCRLGGLLLNGLRLSHGVLSEVKGAKLDAKARSTAVTRKNHGSVAVKLALNEARAGLSGSLDFSELNLFHDRGSFLYGGLRHSDRHNRLNNRLRLDGLRLCGLRMSSSRASGNGEGRESARSGSRSSSSRSSGSRASRNLGRGRARGDLGQSGRNLRGGASGDRGWRGSSGSSRNGSRSSRRSHFLRSRRSSNGRP